MRALRGASGLACAAAFGCALAGGATARGPLAVIGLAGKAQIRVLDCAHGATLAEAVLDAPLSADVEPAPDFGSAYAATASAARGAHLLRYSLPELREQARVPIAFAADTLAAAGGPDGAVLAGGTGEALLAALDLRTLAALHEYRLPAAASVSTVLDTPARRRFAVGFADRREAWEIAYDRDAPPVLKGLVHDYRMREAVELPGRWTPRAFEIPGATRAFVAGAVAHELLRIDVSGTIGVVNLDVRREIERPALAGPHSPERIAAWQGGGRRGWVLAAEGTDELQVLEAGGWRPGAPLPAGGVVLAVTAVGDAVLVARAQQDALEIVRFDVAAGASTRLARLPRDPMSRTDVRFVAGTDGCVALVDTDGRWLASVRR